MEIITQNSFKIGTQLKNRFLCYDGDIIISPDKIMELMLTHKNLDKNIFVDEITEDINQLNKYRLNKIKIKSDFKDLDFSWNIPEEFKDINIEQFVFNKLIENFKLDSNYNGRIIRTKKELDKFKNYNLYDFLNVLIYVVYVFEKHNIVWGVGRGSSVSSFVLYLIGIHDIDSYKYNLTFEDFLK